MNRLPVSIAALLTVLLGVLFVARLVVGNEVNQPAGCIELPSSMSADQRVGSNATLPDAGSVRLASYQSADAPAVEQPQAPPAASGQVVNGPVVTVQFGHVDVFADSGTLALAAYQIEIIGTAPGGMVVLVGVEGVEQTAFAEPPFYDPDALTRERIILAAFTPPGGGGENQLPTGKTRVARLHVQVLTRMTGENNQPASKASFSVRVIAAGNAGGDRIPVEFSLVQTIDE